MLAIGSALTRCARGVLGCDASVHERVLMTAGGHLFLRRGALGDRDAGDAEARPVAGRPGARRVPAGTPHAVTRAHTLLRHFVMTICFPGCFVAGTDSRAAWDVLSTLARRQSSIGYAVTSARSPPDIVVQCRHVARSSTDDVVHAVHSLSAWVV